MLKEDQTSERRNDCYNLSEVH